MDSKLKYGLGGLIVGGLLVWLTGIIALNSNNTNVTAMMGVGNISQKEVKVNSNSLDSHFIEQMIPHHEDAITMSKLALKNAEHNELKTLAQNIISSQGKEIELMKDWYRDWFGKDVPAGDEVMGQHGMMGGSTIHMGIMGNNTDETRLEDAKNFDKSFIEEMIPHHQMAIMMANMLKSQTQRPEMKKLAVDIITAQAKEIGEMRKWYQDWGFSQ